MQTAGLPLVTQRANVEEEGAEARRVEALVAYQKEAVQQQQQALEGLVAEQTELKSQEAELDKEMRRLAQAAPAGLVKQEPSSSSSSSSLDAGSSFPRAVANVGLWIERVLLREDPLPTDLPVIEITQRGIWLETLVVGAMYVLFMMFAAYMYGTCFTYSYPELRLHPVRSSRDDFTFGLLDGCRCDPDWRICCCSWFCAPIRWADTAGSSKVRFLHFWQALILFTVLQVLAGLTAIAGLLLLSMAVVSRQRIRAVYGLPTGDCDSCVKDCFIWMCCTPCAIMQEASQIEFIEIYDEFGQGGASGPNTPFKTTDRGGPDAFPPGGIEGRPIQHPEMSR